MRVTITGIDELGRFNKKLSDGKALTDAVSKLIMDTAMLIRRYAPRNTGALEDSIVVLKTGQNTWYIDVGVPYAYYMEFGTRYFHYGITHGGTAQSPEARTSTSGKPCYHPFMRPAVWQMMMRHKEILKRALFS